VDGDPTNNEANGTTFEHDWQSNQFRFGGDAKGLMNNLDYIQGMGIKVRHARSPSLCLPDLTATGDLSLWNALYQHAMVERWVWRTGLHTTGPPSWHDR
jgi:alpha-1,3-glucan synthase